MSVYNMERTEIYDEMWKNSNVQDPSIWPMWRITKDFRDGKNLEIGPGNRPRISIVGGYFLDISPNAVKNLKHAGGISVIGDITYIPFKDNLFDSVTVIEVLEHIDNDEKAFSEIARVVKQFGFLFFSVPLGMRFFNEVDAIAGHKRRYEIGEIVRLLSENNFRILKFRGPNVFIKLLYKLDDLFLTRVAFRNSNARRALEHSNFSKCIIDLSVKCVASLQKIGAAHWKTNPDDLAKYKERWVVMLCQRT